MTSFLEEILKDKKKLRLLTINSTITGILIALTIFLIFSHQKSLLTPTNTEVIKVTEEKVVAENLHIPWEILFLPSGDMLITERDGNLLRIGKERISIPIPRVEPVGEGGLLGMTLHPDFEENHWIYLYMTTQVESGLKNRIERYTFENNTLSSEKVILENIPGAPYHDGGRIAFGPDGYLYITTGDAGQGELAQDISSLAGKILRVKDDGSIPEDNPFQSPIYSYGHRNPQGIFWDDTGKLWETEHGRSGVLSGLDELNIIEKGKNYGWPIIQGDEVKEGMQSPILESGPDETWAPADILIYKNNIFFTGLRGESLYKAEFNEKTGEIVSLQSYFKKEFGRLRAITLGSDGYFYISTSNTDGRGTIQENDDKIIKINPVIFENTI